MFKKRAAIRFIRFKTRGVAECFKPDKTHVAGFSNSFKNVCGRSTHLLNNAWVYYYFSGGNQLQNLAVSLLNLKTLIKHSCLSNVFSFMNY